MRRLSGAQVASTKAVRVWSKTHGDESKVLQLTMKSCKITAAKDARDKPTQMINVHIRTPRTKITKPNPQMHQPTSNTQMQQTEQH